MREILERRIDQAMGRMAADLVVRNARILDLATGAIHSGDSALGTAMDLRVQLSSCVPATPLETSGARLGAADLVAYRDHPKVIGLAEFMNVPGVLNKDPECLDKLAAFQGAHIDGHAPLLSGRSLNAYLAAACATVTRPPASMKAAKSFRKACRC